MTEFVSRLDSVSKVFDEGPDQVTAVNRATLSISAGKTIGIVGPSGSGKTTLLSLMGILMPPSSGEILFQENHVKDMSPAERRRLRLARIGFVFQQLKLIPTLSVAENVELPMVLNSTPAELRRRKARELVSSVGLAGKENRRPSHLSVGEQQRVAVARALVNDPVLVLADEPTSQLDSSTGIKIVDLLVGLRGKRKAAVVIATHDPKICEKLEEVYDIRDGVLAPKRNQS